MVVLYWDMKVQSVTIDGVNNVHENSSQLETLHIVLIKIVHAFYKLLSSVAQSHGFFVELIWWFVSFFQGSRKS